MHGLITASACTALLALAGCERAKTRLDREVDRLCAKDGGVRVYETVRLPKENFGPDGDMFPPFKGLRGDKGRYGPDYTDVLDFEILHAGNPALERKRLQIVRRSDGKVLERSSTTSDQAATSMAPGSPHVTHAILEVQLSTLSAAFS
jgi:hypothetical protein